MAQAGQLLWTPETPTRTFECEFYFDPTVGLMDIDFHQVTDTSWQHLKSPRPGATARLTIPADTPMSVVQDVVEEIRSKGGYSTIAFAVDSN